MISIEKLNNISYLIFKKINEIKNKLGNKFEYSYSNKILSNKIETVISLHTNCKFSFSSQTIYFSIKNIEQFPLEIEFRIDELNNEGELEKIIVNNLVSFEKVESFILNKFVNSIDIVEGTIKEIPKDFTLLLLSNIKILFDKDVYYDDKEYFEQDNIRSYCIFDRLHNLFPVNLVFNLFGSKTELEIKIISHDKEFYDNSIISKIELSNLFSDKDLKTILQYIIKYKKFIVKN